ncbi:uncharacterized protein MKK02DRAFT_30112 [Dioszegia hungarica]|uniref:Uncharacterized protein n=1 Tax=Dioszegia hungarica TaxID=4972 RepID=A0AA38H1H9_9TREE|nr:uncharacterized protein MKK02DRAFT_30112 [Dioszegia hungarica]KAI9632245.1 hypothetical protein MKK02DRAFT_30112 [Dioszegia hungarica]
MPRNKKSTAATAGTGADPAAQEPAVAAPPAEAGPAAPSVPTTDPSSAFGKQESSGRIRGPVEEVIAKRVRTLGKKIQRFRAYAAQPADKLNADQRAAIASLPVLEAQSRELEDLIKSGGPVEVAELGEAAKMRGLKEDAEKESKVAAEGSSAASLTSLAEPLSRFLKLHALLHPARSADHEHLTFSPLSLPSQLQDEVQATDILRVGKMYEELLGGGEAAAGVLRGLVKGSTGDDEENDHIHKLLELVSQSSVDEAVEPAADADAEVEAAPQTTNGQDRTPVGASMAQDESKSIAKGNGSGHEEEDSAPVHPSKQSGGGLVFLQDDELDSGRTERETEVGQEDGQGQAQAEGDGEGDGFEMVEQPAAHEDMFKRITEHYDTPAPLLAAPSAIEKLAGETFNWADETDEAPASAPARAAETETEKKADEPAAAAEPSASLAVAPDTFAETPAGAAPAAAKSDSPTPRAADGQTGRGGRGGGGGRGRGGPGGRGRGNGNGGNRANGSSPTGPRGGNGNSSTGANGETGQVGLPIPTKPGMGRMGSTKAGVVIDEDGFEMRVKPSARGRGGAGGGAGEGGRGRGRGGFGGQGQGQGQAREGGEYRGGAGGRGRGGNGGNGGRGGFRNGPGGPKPNGNGNQKVTESAALAGAGEAAAVDGRLQ